MIFNYFCKKKYKYMKTLKIWKFVSLTVVLGFMISCKKAPDAITFTSDKLTLVKGETAKFTVTVEGDASWLQLHRKNPGQDIYSEYIGSTSFDYFRFETDSTTASGTYYFYMEARNCGNNNTESGKKCNSLNSNEIVITVN
jgi:hypothetical protein